MGAVTVDLRPLAGADRVLKGQRVELEQAGDGMEAGVIRRAQIEPHDRTRPLQMLTDRRNRKPGSLQHTRAVGPGVRWGRSDRAVGMLVHVNHAPVCAITPDRAIAPVRDVAEHRILLVDHYRPSLRAVSTPETAASRHAI